MAGRFTKLELLGSGTFGRAWLVKNNSTGKNYVCKEVTASGMTEKAKEQSLTEVAALAKCKHLNVIRYRQAFVDKGMLNIIMEYADAGDLHQSIEKQKGKPFEQDVIIDWFVQICFALRYIHRLNILHRDLKTQNIFLTSDNVVKVGDFGIARILQNTDDHAHTAIGTPFYLSPEICQQLPYNHKSDMWAAGCILYELCCLKHPFEAPNLSALIIKILHGTFSPIPSNYGPLVEDLIQVLLSVEVEGRPSAEQVLCIPAMQPYINKYVDRAMSQNQKPTKPVSDASKGYDSPQAMTSTKDTKTTDMPTSPVPQPTETVNAIKGEMLKRTYSLDSLKSKCSPPPGSQQSPDRSVIDSPAITVKFVGARNDGKGLSVVRPGLAVKRGHVPVLEKENIIGDGVSVKRLRKMSLKTPSPVEKLHSDKEINSAKCPTPPHRIVKKKQIPQMSLYKEILRRKALKEIQKRGSHIDPKNLQNCCNSETYTVARSSPKESRTVGSIRKQIIKNSPTKTVKPLENSNQYTNRVNKLLFEHCCLNMDTVYQNMEALCATLETELGEQFVVIHHAFKEAVLTGKSYEEAIKNCDIKCKAYFPLIHHLIQLEVLAKQSML